MPDKYDEDLIQELKIKLGQITKERDLYKLKLEENGLLCK